MPIDDPSPDNYQRWFGIGTFIGGAITAVTVKLRHRGTHKRISEERLREIIREEIRDPIASEIEDSETLKSIERRLQGLEYRHDEDRAGLARSLAAIHRSLSELRDRY